MSKLIPILNRSIEEVVDKLDETTDIIDTSLADHRLIVEMMSSRNASGAKAAMYVHMCHAFNTAGLILTDSRKSPTVFEETMGRKKLGNTERCYRVSACRKSLS